MTARSKPPSPACSCTSVACRGSKRSARPASRCAIDCADDPLMRTTPIPPRPGGVAMATMVSVVLNTGGRLAAALLADRDDDGLQKCIADALRRHLRILGDGEMDEAPRIWVQRTDLLRRAGRLRTFHHEARHLPQFGVFALAVVEAIDHERAIAVELPPESGVDDVLERVQGLGATAQQNVALSAGEINPHAVGCVAD